VTGSHQKKITMKLKKLIARSALALSVLFSSNAEAQTSCCDKEKKAQTSECCGSSKNEQTSGCSPSSCRGAQTKFGEAKVITDLRADLIALKALMEQSKSPVFSKRSYDIHGIVGETDEESISIIASEIQLIESEVTKTKKHRFENFELPENKARQIKYLKERITAIEEVLA